MSDTKIPADQKNRQNGKSDLERAKEAENRIKERDLEVEEISTWNDEGGNSAQYADEEGDIPKDGGNSTKNSGGKNRKK